MIRKGYRNDIAKAVGVSTASVKQTMKRLVKMQLVRYVSNREGNNLGVYMFHPGIEALSKKDSEINFKFEIQ